MPERAVRASRTARPQLTRPDFAAASGASRPPDAAVRCLTAQRLCAKQTACPPVLSPARLSDVIDDHFGELVPDPYRWLEDTDAEETEAWVKAENELTESFLARRAHSGGDPRTAHGAVGLPQVRRSLRARRGLVPGPQLGTAGPARSLRHGAARTPRAGPLLDPNLLSDDGTVAVTGLEVDRRRLEARLCHERGGSDWRTWQVRDVATGLGPRRRRRVVEVLLGRLAQGRLGLLLLRPGAAAAEGPSTSSESRLQRIFFHRLGTATGDDELVFAAPEQPEWLPDAGRQRRRPIPARSRSVGAPFRRPGARPRPRGSGGRAYGRSSADFASKAIVVTNVGNDLLSPHRLSAPTGRGSSPSTSTDRAGTTGAR